MDAWSTKKFLLHSSAGGALSHTAASTSKFLKAKKIKVLQDMNITEHVWGHMKEEARKKKIQNLDELWESWKTAYAIQDDFVNSCLSHYRVVWIQSSMLMVVIHDIISSSQDPWLYVPMIFRHFWVFKINIVFFFLETAKSDLSAFIKLQKVNSINDPHFFFFDEHNLGAPAPHMSRLWFQSIYVRCFNFVITSCQSKNI